MQIARFVLNGQATLSPWLPRRADNAIFGYEVLQQLYTGDAMAVTVYHKNKEDPGSGEVHSLPTWDTDGTVRTATFEGLKEMVRFAFTAGGAVGVVFRMLQPTWYDDAN